MSYCRFGKDSDVYAYCHGLGYTIHISGGDILNPDSLEEFYKDMKFLKMSGCKIPKSTFERIEKELDNPR